MSEAAPVRVRDRLGIKSYVVQNERWRGNRGQTLRFKIMMAGYAVIALGLIIYEIAK